MNRCTSEEVLARLLAGELTTAECETLDTHLSACPDCQRVLAALSDGENASRWRRLRQARVSSPDEVGALTETPPWQWRTLAPGLVGPPRDLDPTFPSLPGYQVLSQLGRGGMGVVYLARQLSLGRLVALKMLRAGGHAPADELQRFRTEAEAIARLQHPNIVAVYEVGVHEGAPYLTLEFCAGGSLNHRLHGTSLDPNDAARLLATLARAIHAAHQSGIIHRDLKPANVLLVGEPDTPVAHCIPKVTDFGLAKKLDEQGAGLTKTGEVIGTPSYMAPEQALGSPEVGPACDVYSLGAILYECLTGRSPFKATTLAATLSEVIHRDPVSVRTLQPQVPRPLETICLKCLNKDPAARYATARELAEDLEAFLRHEPIRARPASPVGKLVRWGRRQPLAAGLLAAGLLAPLVALGVLSLLSARLVRSSALDSAAQQAELLEEANNEYSRIVQRVEKAAYPINKTVPPTPGTIPLSIPATFLHDVGEQLSQHSRTGVQVRQYSDHPFPWRRDGGPRDDFEVRALQRLRASGGQEDVHEFAEVDGRRVVRYARARVMRASCVDCHNTHPQSPRKDWQEGDVRGVLEILRPLDADEARVNAALRLALLLSAAVSLLLLGGSALVLWANHRRRGA